MPAKKTKVWEDNYQAFLDDYHIVFKGPEQPSNWPEEHKHLFEVVRNIWATRYAKYKKSEKLDVWAVKKRRDKAAEIAAKTHQTRIATINEDTWRGLAEAEVKRMLERPITCNKCTKELHTAEHEAIPSAGHEFFKLQRKRGRRRACRCHLIDFSADMESGDSQSDQSIKAQPVIFTASKSTNISHNPLDGLEEFDVPIQPDLTVGVNVSPGMRKALRLSSSTDLSHYPIQGTPHVVYPFLLIEAKRAAAAPAFVAIEAQTAFPVRRLLMLQEDLGRESGLKFDPLVWFFAYRGEEWRLYAGTLQKAEQEFEVHVYDLWHGTVESRDGSLQLLQIVDYIWTWARDIYRPQIRRCLCALERTTREITPSTDAALSRSQSVLSDLRLGPMRPAQVDVVMEDDQETNGYAPPTVLSVAHDNRLHLLQYGPDWPHALKGSMPYARLRHSDLINFSFRAFHCPTREQVRQYPHLETGYDVAMERFDSLLQSESLITLKHGQIDHLERFWTRTEVPPASIPVSAAVSEKRKIVFVHFRTFCRPQDWQIVRELNCILWDAADVQRHRATTQLGTLLASHGIAGDLDHYGAVVEQLFRVRDISGKASVAYALKNTSLILSRVPNPEDDAAPLRWVQGRSPFLDQFDKPASRSYWPPNFYREIARLAPLRQGLLEGRGIADIVPFPEDIGKMGGIMAQRPRSRSAHGERFCLYVLLEIEASDSNRLRQLLVDVVQERIFHGAGDEGLGQEEPFVDAEDRRMIRKWVAALTS